MPRLDKQNMFKSYMQKIKGYFYEQKWKDTLIFLFFVLLSFGFWYLAALQEEYEIEISVPVRYRNIPPEIVLSEENPQHVLVKVKDKGTVLINYSWPRNFSPIEVNMKGVSTVSGELVVLTKKKIESVISKQLISSSSLISIEPQSFQVEYAELSKKEVPVIPNLNITLAPGFRLTDSIILAPAFVSVYGNKKQVDSLTFIETEYVEVKEANRTRELKLKLEKVKGVRIEPSEIKATISVEEFIEKRLKLPVLFEAVPDYINIRLFPATVEVVFNLPISKYKEINEEDFEIRIPFADFEKNQVSGEIPIYLTKKSLISVHPVLIPDKIEFIIETNKP